MAMINFTFSGCSYLLCNILVYKLFLLVAVLYSQKIEDGQLQESEDIVCDEVHLSWYSFDFYFNGTGIKCYTYCSANCTCLLDNDRVIANCSSGHVTVTPVIYSTYKKFLSWEDSILHDINPGSFLRLSKILQGLHLTNVSLQSLKHGIFAGLEDLKYLYLDYNKLCLIIPGAFENLAQLQMLSLYNNMLSEIQSGMFRGLIGLERLYLEYNMIHAIEQGAFNELLRLKLLRLDDNMLTRIETGVFENLSLLHILSLADNMLSEIEVGQFNGLKSLTALHLFRNSMYLIEAGSFACLINLDYIILSSNDISYLDPTTFAEMRNLTSIDIKRNDITTFHAETFKNQVKLDYLEIQNNKLHFLPKVLFHSLQQLRYVNLSFNNLNRIPAELFLSCIRLKIVDLKGNPLMWIEKHALASLNDSAQLIVTDFATCCFTSAHCISSPPLSPYITCRRLLPYNVLRIAIWLVCGFTVLGNGLVFYSRVRQKQQRHKVQTFLITNLSLSDFLMGLYLITLLSVDLYYKDYFPSHSEGWRSSILCRLAGAFSVLSSEASVFFITLITIDRFLGVKYTFSRLRFGIKFVRILVALLWAIACTTAITVFVLSQKDSDFYAVSEVCVGLPISRQSTHWINETIIMPDKRYDFYKVSVTNYVNRGRSASMFFSIALFTGFNLICFFIVGYCYVAIFIYARKTTKQSGRPLNQNEEIRMTMKMFLLVFTDFCCWVPVGFLSILVQTGAVNVDPVAYAWIATFVLPINSSINPYLYTLASVLSNKAKMLRRETSRKKTIEESVPMKPS